MHPAASSRQKFEIASRTSVDTSWYEINNILSEGYIFDAARKICSIWIKIDIKESLGGYILILGDLWYILLGKNKQFKSILTYLHVHAFSSVQN